MSSIYNLEPQPTASAIIHTTQGEIAVELFAKQTPLTCRNFLQLSLDGYYDNTIFHRLVPGFILQGGDPTGTGQGGESIYDGGAFSGDLDPWPMDQRKGQNAGPMGVNFKDEFHSRLKFNRRVSSAWQMRASRTPMGASTERPLYPIKITHIEILINPFDDMKKRERKVRHEVSKPAPIEKKQKKRKAGKQLLSFGDEEGDAEDLPVVKKAKFDTRIVMDVDEEPTQKAIPVRASVKKETKARDKEAPVPETRQIAARKSPSAPEPVPVKKPPPSKTYDSEESSSEAEQAPRKSLLERTNEEIAAVKASMKRTIHTEPVKEKPKSALELMVPETSVRGRKRRPGGNNLSAREEQDVLDSLKAFRSKLERAPAEKEVLQPTADEGGENGEQDEEGEVCDLHFIANCQSCKAWDKEAKDESDDEGWMSHTLSFVADKLGKDLNYRKKAEEELVVIDPLEKARTLKEDKRAARDTRTGGSSRAWDRDQERDRDRDRNRERDRGRRDR
ncbi:hypothetical protein NEMBOFW57_009781 [Staphylotrichum longicolle]|uniref:PPIase cyclophilin-type domain-containing protein n=1 Tax=Staphylotrichum longicolle TaxID=669026 RepID=A0AAD4EPY4_9PEZI|nr:hypothetical protein NEMBOFW57_009781 [Staphylotrichum longicolle]